MRSQVRNRRGLSAVLLLVSLALAVSAQATTYTETFDGPLNPALWTPFSSNGASVQVDGGELVVAIPTHSSSVDPGAGIQSTFDVGGAFTLEVDYHVVTWPTDGNSAGLYVKTANVMRMARGQLMNYHYPGWWYDERYYSVINGGGPYEAATGDTSGKLLISRSSDFWVATKYWNGSSWTQVGSSVHMYDDGILTLSAWGSDTAAMEVHFDNLIVTSDNVPVPLPPTALLLGSGLLVLGLPGLRRKLRRG